MKKESPSRLTRVIAAVLTALFIPAIFAGGVYGLATHWDDVLHSLRFSKSRSYLENPDDTSFFAMTKARIQSLAGGAGRKRCRAEGSRWAISTLRFSTR